MCTPTIRPRTMRPSDNPYNYASPKQRVPMQDKPSPGQSVHRNKSSNVFQVVIDIHAKSAKPCKSLLIQAVPVRNCLDFNKRAH
jgi:hypothetical protein